jgi:hypothetical protein
MLWVSKTLYLLLKNIVCKIFKNNVPTKIILNCIVLFFMCSKLVRTYLHTVDTYFQLLPYVHFVISTYVGIYKRYLLFLKIIIILKVKGVYDFLL